MEQQFSQEQVEKIISLFDELFKTIGAPSISDMITSQQGMFGALDPSQRNTILETLRTSIGTQLGTAFKQSFALMQQQMADPMMQAKMREMAGAPNVKEEAERPVAGEGTKGAE